MRYHIRLSVDYLTFIFFKNRRWPTKCLKAVVLEIKSESHILNFVSILLENTLDGVLILFDLKNDEILNILASRQLEFLLAKNNENRINSVWQSSSM